DKTVAGHPKSPVPVRVDREGSTRQFLLQPKEIDGFSQGLQWDMGTVVGQVLIGYPAYEAGLREGDEILRIDGQRVLIWTELSSTLRSKPETTRALLVRRGNHTFTVHLKTSPEGTIGISPPETITFRQSFTIDKAVLYGTQQTFWVIGQIYGGLWSFI